MVQPRQDSQPFMLVAVLVEAFGGIGPQQVVERIATGRVLLKEGGAGQLRQETGTRAFLLLVQMSQSTPGQKALTHFKIGQP